MPLNLIKTYSDLLEIMHLDINIRKQSLKRIFSRDIEENIGFSYRGKIIRPVKKDDGVSSMDTLFNHLITEDEEYIDEHNKKQTRRVFERDRSERLHWLKHCLSTDNMVVFSVEERDRVKRKDVIRTYVLDEQQKYVIVLEPQKSGLDYYLLTGYFLNRDYASKQMKKKYKKRLPDIL